MARAKHDDCYYQTRRRCGRIMQALAILVHLQPCHVSLSACPWSASSNARSQVASFEQISGPQPVLHEDNLPAQQTVRGNGQRKTLGRWSMWVWVSYKLGNIVLKTSNEDPSSPF